MSGFTKKQSVQVGIGMIARAEVALIVANQGLRSGIISNETFTSIVLLVVISTIITPPLLKTVFKGEKPVELVKIEEWWVNKHLKRSEFHVCIIYCIKRTWIFTSGVI